MNCPICNHSPIQIIEEANEVEFRKEKFIVYDKYYKCENCDNEITDDELADKHIIQLYNQYREKHNLLFPEEIKELREKYGLSKTKMSLALGWGENTYANYEKGALPNESHNSLLSLIEEPEQFMKLAKQRTDMFSESEIKEIENNSEKDTKVNIDEWIKCLWPKKIKSDTGYAKPDLVKFTNMVIYFSSKEKPYKTKLNKLLYYADSKHYKDHFVSISGSRYRAIQYGPVPNDYDAIYNWQFKNEYINIEENTDDIVTERIEAKKEFNRNIFNDDELATLEYVYNTFKVMSASQIREFSHKEYGWIDNYESKAIIDYQKYAVKLSI